MNINLNASWTPRSKQVFNFFFMITSFLAKIDNASWCFVDVITIDGISMFVGVLPASNVEDVPQMRGIKKRFMAIFPMVV